VDAQIKNINAQVQIMQPKF